MNQSRPIVFWDKRLSTPAVTRTLLDAGASRAKHAAVVDKMAAPKSSRTHLIGWPGWCPKKSSPQLRAGR